MASKKAAQPVVIRETKSGKYFKGASGYTENLDHARVWRSAALAARATRGYDTVQFVPVKLTLADV